MALIKSLTSNPVFLSFVAGWNNMVLKPGAFRPWLKATTLTLVIFLFSIGISKAQITSTSTGGPWATNSTWVGNVVPTAGQNVIIATTGGYTVDIQATINQTGTITINSGAILTATTGGVSVTMGALTISTGGTLTTSCTLAVNGTANITGTINLQTTARTHAFNGDITLNSGAVWNETVANTPTITGSLTNNATTFIALGTYTFNKASGGTLSGTTTTSIPSVTFSTAYTNSGILTVGTALGGLSLTQGANSTLNIGGTSGITTLTAAATGNTVNYTGAGQTVHPNNYYNLTLSGSGTVALQTATTTISGNMTLSGTVTTTAVVNLVGITGNLNIGDGTIFNTGTFTIPVTGATTVGGGTSGQLTFSGGTKTFTGDVTINSGAVWNETAFSTINFGGSLTNNGTFTAAGGPHNFIGATKTLSGASTIAIPTSTFTGAYTNNGVFSSSNAINVNGTTLTNNNTITASGALSGTGGLTQGAAGILNLGGTSGISTLDASTNAGNTVNYNGGGGQTIHSNNYYNLNLSGSAKTLQVGTTSIGGNLTLSTTATATTVADLAITGNLSIGNGPTFTAAAFALTVNGTTTVGGGASGNLIISSSTGSKTFIGLITVAAGATWNNSGNSPITFRGGITNSGSFTAGTGIYTFDTNAQSLTGTGTFTIPSVTVTGITLTNNNTLTIATALSGTGGLTQAAGSTLSIGGTSAITTLDASTNANTVNFTGAAQTINAVNYSSLGLSGGAAKTLAAGTTSISGTLTLSGAGTSTAPAGGITIGGAISIGAGTTFTAGAFTHNIAGNWSNLGTFTNTGSTINFNGTAAQGISGNSTTFNNLSLSGSNTVTFSVKTVTSANLSISGTALANLGTLTTHTANTLTLGGTPEQSGTWGGNTGATYRSATYFVALSGIVTVAASSCTAGVWTGFTNTDWNTTTNWCTGVVPTNATNVVIPPVNNQPIIGAAAVCNNITINTGATLTITGANTLTVSGNWSNAGTLTPNTSKVTFNGSSPSIGGTASTTFNNLTLNTAGSTNLTVNSNITVNGAIAWLANGLVNVSSTGNVTLGPAGSISAPTTSRYIQLDGSTGTNSNLIVTSDGTSTSGTGSWGITYPIGDATGGYTPFTLGTMTAAATGTSPTISVKAIYNNSNQGELRRVFRLTVSNNNAASTFPNGSFNISTGTGVLTGALTPNTSALSGMTGSFPITYTNISATGGTGTGAQFTVLFSAANTVTSVTVTSGGSGYKSGDVLTFAGSSFAGSGSATFNVTATNIVSPDVSSGDALANYTKLWYLASTSGSWNSPTSYTAATSPFTVNSGGPLTNGTYYYTIGQPSAYPNTWYSYQTGVWSNWQNWTSDPSGSTLVNGLNLPPQSGDAIVILSGITITNDANLQVASATTINAGGILDLAATTNNTLGTVSGTGTLRIQGINLPPTPGTTYTSFVAATTGGTIEYYDAGATVTLPIGQNTYNNLKLSGYSASSTFVEASDLTINGDFTIGTGSGVNTATWQINDNTANQRTITLNGNLNVANNGAITVLGGTAATGATATPHSITLNGDFTNNGTVRFFDNTASTALLSDANWTSGAVYTQTTRGFGSEVTFANGTNQTATCNGITYFYQLTMNKGTGPQAVLTINSGNTNYFRLYGPATIGSAPTDGGATDDLSTTSNNALSLVNGTLLLEGAITIPKLIAAGTCIGTNCGNYFAIPQTAGLTLNSSSVSVTIADNTTSNTDQRFLLQGVLTVINGTLATGYSKGLITGAAGALVVQGGTLNTWQIRPSSAGLQNFTYLQSGGTVNVGTTGYTVGSISTPALSGYTSKPNYTYARFAILAGAFQMSGGTLNIGQPTQPTNVANGTGTDHQSNGALAGGIDIESASGNYNVTGGTVNVYIPTGTVTQSGTTTGTTWAPPYNFTIYSTAPLYNLMVYREGTTGTSAATVKLNNSLTVLNDLTLVTGNAPTLDCNGTSYTFTQNTNGDYTGTSSTPAVNNNLTIGGNFIINSGTTFIPSTGTGVLTFNGSASQSWTNSGTISATIPSVVVNKTGTLTIPNPSGVVNALGQSISSLTLTSGTVDDGSNTITVTTSLSNSATHVSSSITSPTARTGSITYSATGTPTIGGTGGTFGNLILNGATSTTATTSGTLTVTGNLQLNGGTQSILNIGAYNLTVNGAITTTQNSSNLGANWCIQTNGVHDAGGLTRPCVKGTPLTFPLGTVVSGTGLYTPNTITVSTATTVGTITVMPVNHEHPNVTTTGQSLQYYWRVVSSGFVGLGTANGSVVHSNYTFSTATKQNSSNKYVAARYDRSANTWGQCSSASTMTTTILPSSFNTGSTTATWTGVTGDQLDGEYTCGNGVGGTNAFGTVTVYYSIATGNWNTTGTWSTDNTLKNAGVSCSCFPPSGSTSPVIIGDGASHNHKVTIPNGSGATQMCGSLSINASSTLDCGTNANAEGALGFGTNTTVSSAVGGTGTLRIGLATSSGTTGHFPSGDFTNFLEAGGGTVEYYGTSITALTIPSIYISPINNGTGNQPLATYYNLVINPFPGQTITMPSISSLTVYNNLNVGTPTTYTGTVQTNGVSSIAIANNLNVNAGTLTAISNITLTLSGDVTVGSLTTTAATFKSTGGVSTLSTTGNITNYGTINFNNGGTLDLTFTGASSKTITNSGSAGLTVNNVTVNKGTAQTYSVTLNNTSGTVAAPTTSTTGWLTLTNGSFIFNDTKPNSYTICSSTTSGWTIASTSNLTVQAGNVTILSGNNTAADLFLNGSLTVSGGTVNVGTLSNTIDNDIEYASTGSPTINVSSGALNVNGSVRRSLNTLNGALVYSQSGGTVTVSGEASSNSRGIFEIENNTGSSFMVSGNSNLIIQNPQTVTTGSYADLYLNPAVSSVSAVSGTLPTITIGVTGTNNNFRLNIAPTIGNLTLLSGANATGSNSTMYSNDLVLAGNLVINSNAKLNTNSLDVSIAGNLNKDSGGTYTGAYNGASNTTTFNGATAQAAYLTSASSFANMTVSNTGSSGNNTVTLSGTTAPALTNLKILSGILDVGAFALTVNGDITNNSSQTASGGGSITFTTTTTASHTITSSNGSFTNLKIGGATSTTNNLVTVNGNMTMNGSLDFVSTTATRYLFIGSNLLTFGSTASIANAGTNTFIKTNGVSSDLGVTKIWPTGTNSFTYEVGTRTNYTPVFLTNLVVTTGGNYNVVPVDAIHPTASPINPYILDYYWKIIRDGSIFHGATGTLKFQVPGALLSGSSGTLLGAYLDAINLIGWTSGGTIAPAVPPGPIGATETLTFTNSFTGTPPAAVLPAANGEFDYTYGTNTTLPSPITPVYSRISNPNVLTTSGIGGSWSDPNSWTLANDGNGVALSSVPTGRPFVILPTARINLDVNTPGQNASAFKTTISGLLMVTTIGHSLGSIVNTTTPPYTSTGTMKTTVTTLPSGTYNTVFTAANGGTIEYAAAISMSPQRDTYNNLIISSNVSTLVNCSVNGNLTIGTGNTLNNSANINISLLGNWINNGTLTAFTGGSGIVSFNGTAAQTITGATTFTNLTINNTNATPPQITLSGSDEVVSSTLTMTKGNIFLNGKTLTIGTSATSTGTLSHSLASTSGWMYGGSLTRYFNTSTIAAGTANGLFPMGTTADFRPFFIGVTTAPSLGGSFTLSNSSATNTVALLPTITDTGGNPSPTIYLQHQGSWSVSQSGIGTGGVYDVLAGGTGFGTINSYSDVTLCKTNSTVGQWVLPSSNSFLDPRMKRTTLSLSDITTNGGGNQFFVGSTDAINSPLPIELLSFTGESKKYGVDLQWQTASEMNNDYFTVSRSPSGASFESIGTVNGNGTTNSSHSYALIDYKPLLGKNYYQLKQTDFDGHITTSETIVVDVLSLDPLVSIYPNPLSQNQLLNVTINGLAANSPTEIQIVNVQGIKVNGATFNTDSDGSLKTSIALTGLSAGLYILKIQNVHYKFVIE